MTDNMITTDIGDDLYIRKIVPRDAAPGTWVLGALNGHTFSALVFPEHADCADYELGQSRISKLWLKRIEDQKVVANFDRGWDIEPETELAAGIVGFLEAGLADFVYAD